MFRMFPTVYHELQRDVDEVIEKETPKDASYSLVAVQVELVGGWRFAVQAINEDGRVIGYL